MDAHDAPYRNVDDHSTAPGVDRPADGSIDGKGNCFIDPKDPDIIDIIGNTHKVLYIVKCDEEMASTAFWQPLALLLLPCLWAHALLMSPFLCYGNSQAKIKAAVTYYIITDKALITLIKSHDTCCGTSGDDYHIIKLDTIQSVDVDNKGSGICGSLSVLNVNTHGNRFPTKLMVHNPRELSELLQRVTDDMNHNVEHKVEPPLYFEGGAKPNSPQNVKPVEVAAPSNKIRIFVATKADPAAFKLVVFSDGNFQELWDKVHKLFGNEYNQFHLAAEGVLIDDLSGLQNNDKLLVS